MVLAPFTTNSINNDTYVKEETYRTHTSNRKFIINLGWIPRSRKHLVYDTIGNESFSTEVFPDRLEALEK